MQQKINVLATDDVYKSTRERMTLAEEESKKVWYVAPEHLCKPAGICSCVYWVNPRTVGTLEYSQNRGFLDTLLCMHVSLVDNH